MIGVEGCDHLDAHVHARLLEVHVQAGNLGIHHPLGHALGCPAHVEGVAIQQGALSGALAMGLQHIDGLHRVLRLLAVCSQDTMHRPAGCRLPMAHVSRTVKWWAGH